MRTLHDIDLQGKTVLLRADYNVPLENGKITDDYRVLQSLPTIEYLLKQQCRIVILSHLGRPEGQRNDKYSLRPVAIHLAQLLKRAVVLADSPADVDTAANQVTLLENLRFWPGEEANDVGFAQELAELGEVFVQDGFGVVHRAHASTAAIAQYLPSVAGLLLDKEVAFITDAMESPKRPLVVIFGGAKISDKIQVIERFIDRADSILIGGAMANTFLAYAGLPIGKSIYEPGQEEMIEGLLHKVLEKEETDCSACRDLTDHNELLAAQHTIDIPTDVAVAPAIEESARRRIVTTDAVGEDEYILDLGPETIRHYQEILAAAGTVVWNGPVGYTELSQFREGSNLLATTLKEHKDYLQSIIGGGDTAGFVLSWDVDAGGSFSHVSTGGGAALDLMAGKELPGIAALSD
ncbi:MAG: phosphoglycerate kinase [Candidatus Saccharimonadales bacterium]